MVQLSPAVTTGGLEAWLAEQRVLVVGVGSIGRRHFDNLRRLPPLGGLAAAANSPFDRLPDDAADYRLYGSLAEALAEFRPTIGLVTNASPAHVVTAQALADVGAHLFIEKPVADRFDGIEALTTTCRTRSLTTMVAYTLRFVASVARTRALLQNGVVGRPLFLAADVGQYLPDWRPGSDYRAGVSARRDLGGGVLLELSHEIDYVRWMLGEPDAVFAVASRSGVIDVDVEDSADALLSYATGARARIHLDFLERGKSRRCRIVGTEGTIETDLIAGTVSVTTVAAPTPVVETPVAQDPYMNELIDFLAAAAEGRASSNPLEDGVRTLRLVEAIRCSAARNAPVSLASIAAPGAPDNKDGFDR
jgi:predicted dehydrogenase